MKKVLFGVVVGILTGIGIYAYAKQRAEDANDVDVEVKFVPPVVETLPTEAENGDVVCTGW